MFPIEPAKRIGKELATTGRTNLWKVFVFFLFPR